MVANFYLRQKRFFFSEKTEGKNATPGIFFLLSNAKCHHFDNAFFKIISLLFMNHITTHFSMVVIFLMFLAMNNDVATTVKNILLLNT